MLLLLLIGLTGAIDPLLIEICGRAPHIATMAHNWCHTDVDVCEWEHVDCVYPATLYGVSLANIPLGIELPIMSLAETQLRVIGMSNCSLRGDLVSQILSPQTDVVDFSHNPQLVGFLPPFAMRNLRSLSLARCGLTANVASHLCGGVEGTRLDTLDLSENALVGPLSACVGDTHMPRMRHFNISHNQFSGRAPIFVRVVSYDIAYNKFDSIEDGVLERKSVSAPIGSGFRVAIPSGLATPTLKKCDIRHNAFAADTTMPRWLAESEVKGNPYCGFSKSSTV